MNSGRFLKVGEDVGSVLSLVKRPRDDDDGRGDEDVGTGPPLPLTGIGNRPPSGICQDGRRVGPVAVIGAPSVYDFTERMSSDSAASERSESVKISLFVSDPASASLASVGAVANSRPLSSLLSNKVRSAGAASGGGGFVHLLLFGAMCSGGAGDAVEICPLGCTSTRD